MESLDLTTLPPLMRSLYSVLAEGVADSSPLGQEILEDSVSMSGIMGALFALCQKRNLPLRLFNLELGSHPLPAYNPKPTGFRYVSSLHLEADGMLLSVDYNTPLNQVVGPVCFASPEDLVAAAKATWKLEYHLFGEQEGEPYASPLALRFLSQHSLDEAVAISRAQALEQTLSSTSGGPKGPRL